MILTTKTNHSFTTTVHNNKSYIFTLYLFMFLCVVSNCLLFYCSCTGNCENCCGINGLLRIANIDQDGKIDGNNILNGAFINGEKKASVDVSIYRGSTEKDYNDAKKEFLENINTKVETTYLIAYVEVGDTARYFIHCTDANSKKNVNITYGLFKWSAATKIEILSCGNNITNMSYMFAYCLSLTELDLSNLKMDKVTNMSRMFHNCSSLTNLNLSKWDTNNVTDMRYMFGDCSSLKELNLSKWNNNTVTDMSFMFSGCSSLINLDLSNFNTNNVTNMNGMFSWCRSLKNLELSSFNTSNVTDVSEMFFRCTNLTNIKFSDNFNASNVTNMRCMFYNCNKLLVLNLSKFNTNNVKDMRFMFFNCSSLTELDLSKWDTNNVTDMRFMFYGCSDLTNLNLSNFNTDKVTGMYSMFYNCFQNKATLICQASTIKKIADNGNSCLIITNENEKKINDELNKNLDQVCTCTVKREEKDINPQIISVYKFKDMPSDGRIDGKQIVNVNFANAKLVKYVQIGSEVDKQAFEKIKESINPTGEKYLYAYVKVKKEDNNVVRYLIYCTDADIKNINGLFDGSAATKIEILSCGNWITDMSNMFYNCSSLKELDLSKFNTDNVTNMRSMFYNCSSLTILDLSKFNTDKVTNMYCMFCNCSSLTKLNLSKFNTQNVTDMSWMFDNCSKLSVLNLSNFNTDKVTNIRYMSGMFYKCFKEEHTSTLICKASTIQKIADNRGSCLIIPNEKKSGFENIIGNNNNPEQVYTCSVKRGRNEDNSQITAVEKYKQK